MRNWVVDKSRTFNWVSYLCWQSRKTVAQDKIKSLSMKTSTCWCSLSAHTFYLTETCSFDTIQETQEKLLDGLKSWEDESDMASLCSTLKLLIAHQMGGPKHHLHELSAALHCVNEWWGVLHMGDWDWTFAVVPLHVYSASSKQQSYIYPNVSNRYGWCRTTCNLLTLWFRRRASCCRPAVKR